MKKNFITVTPDSGTSGSSNTISVAAEPNILLKERSEILNFNASVVFSALRSFSLFVARR